MSAQRRRRWTDVVQLLFNVMCLLGLVYLGLIPPITRLTNAGLLLAHRLRRWYNIKPVAVKVSRLPI